MVDRVNKLLKRNLQSLPVFIYWNVVVFVRHWKAWLFGMLCAGAMLVMSMLGK